MWIEIIYHADSVMQINKYPLTKCWALVWYEIPIQHKQKKSAIKNVCEMFKAITLFLRIKRTIYYTYTKKHTCLFMCNKIKKSTKPNSEELHKIKPNLYTWVSKPVVSPSRTTSQ